MYALLLPLRAGVRPGVAAFATQPPSAGIGNGASR
jgi:hypothetical protein